MVDQIWSESTSTSSESTSGEVQAERGASVSMSCRHGQQRQAAYIAIRKAHLFARPPDFAYEVLLLLQVQSGIMHATFLILSNLGD